MTASPASLRRYHSWFVTLPLLAVSVGFMLWFYRPMRNSIGEMESELAIKQVGLAASADLPDRIRRRQKEIVETRRFVQAWQETASPDDVAAVFGEILQILRASGANVTKFDPEPALDLQSIRQVPLAIVCQGTFPQVFEMMRELENLPSTIWINELRIKRIDANSGTLACEIKLAIFTGQRDSTDSAH